MNTQEAFQQLIKSGGIGPSGNQLQTCWFDTTIGAMIAIADTQQLYLLEFFDRKNIHSDIERLCKDTNSVLQESKNPILDSIKSEMDMYFAGQLQQFKTPYRLIGSDFQTLAWQKLAAIPYGHNISYLEQAQNIGRANSFRAVANANARNRLAIIVPCHRVINTSGALGGYGAGVERKRYLQQHEMNFRSK